MLTKRTEFGKIEILPDGQIQLREDTVIEEDGVELSRLYHRAVLEPKTDASHPDVRVSAVAAILWTPEVVDAYEKKKADNAKVLPADVPENGQKP